jgi:asparagine synthase (glutamine-hydrolysing)
VFADYVNALPLAYKQRAGDQKILLKAIGQPYLPAGLFDRPKQGFDIPLRAWLDGPLHGFAEERLVGDQLGLFAPSGMRDLLNLQHRSTRDISPRVWTLLSLATWADSAAAGIPW